VRVWVGEGESGWVRVGEGEGEALGKIFDTSVPDLWQIRKGSCKDLPFFPEEMLES